MASCTVFWAASPVAISSGAEPQLRALLDAHERDRLDRFRRHIDQARYLAAHALARLTLAEVLDTDPGALRFDRTCRCGQQHGKPRLVGDGPEFSITHAGALVGVALHDRPLGVDVEQVRPLSELASMASHICSPNETAPDADAFFRLWTRKEAVLKATGHGLSTPMSDVTLGPHGVAAWADAPGPIWLHDLYPAPGHPATVAGVGPVAPLVVERDGNLVLRRP